MKFADFSPGMVLTHGPQSLTAHDITRYANEWDPQWFHTDADRAASGRFGELIASGWQTCGLAMRMAVACALHDSESFASPGLAYLKWPNPVKAGEPLRLRATVLECRRSASQPQLGILRWRWELLHADGRQALDLEATSLFDLAAPPGATG